MIWFWPFARDQQGAPGTWNVSITQGSRAFSFVFKCIKITPYRGAKLTKMDLFSGRVLEVLDGLESRILFGTALAMCIFPHIPALRVECQCW